MGRIVTFTANPSVDVSATVPALVPFSKMRCSNTLRNAGGGGINVARVVKRFGGEVLAVYPSGGFSGQWLNAHLKGEGVAIAPVECAAETREDVTVSEEASAKQYRFVFPGSALAAQEWAACLDAFAAAIDEGGLAVASGSLPPAVPSDAYAQIARIARARGARVAVDTSGAALKAALREGVHLIKPNLREFQELTGESASEDAALVSAARRLVEGGQTDAVALTLGPRGAFLIARDGAWHADALPVKAVSVVGAGDSFLGALVWRLSLRGDYSSALKCAVAAGSAAVLNPGTELCKEDDVLRLLDRVTVRRV